MKKLYRVYSETELEPRFLWLTEPEVVFWRREGFYVAEA